MQFFRSLEVVPKDFGPSAVTVGKFDGVHAGHRRVIAELKSVAQSEGLVATVVTFDRHPLSLLRPADRPEALLSNAQKVELLARAGVEATLMLAFDLALSHQTPEEFVRHVLVDALNTRTLLVGSDFRFGAKGAGTVATLTDLAPELGFDVRLIDDVRPSGDRRASSTWIRELLSTGQVREAAELLGQPATIRSIVVRGEQRGRTLGYPTANLSPDIEGFVPADGVYAAWATFEGRRYPAAVSVGNNPTFEGVPDKQVEAHLLDQNLDLYGKRLEVSFVEYIRPMVRFDSIAPLIAQMHLDEAAVREVLASA